MSLVEDHEVVGCNGCFLKPGEHALAGQCVEADDEPVAVRALEGIPSASLGSRHDAELEAEQTA